MLVIFIKCNVLTVSNNLININENVLFLWVWIKVCENTKQSRISAICTFFVTLEQLSTRSTHESFCFLFLDHTRLGIERQSKKCTDKGICLIPQWGRWGGGCPGMQRVCLGGTEASQHGFHKPFILNSVDTSNSAWSFALACIWMDKMLWHHCFQAFHDTPQALPSGSSP